MARSAAQIQSDIEALTAKMGKGVLKVEHGDTRVTSQTVSEMALALRILQDELREARADGVRQVRFQTSKGLNAV